MVCDMVEFSYKKRGVFMAMKVCQDCGTELSSKAKICPKCGRDQRNFYSRHKVLMFIFAIICLGAIGAALGGGENGNTLPTNANIAEQRTEYNQGEEARLGNGAITVTKVQRSQGNSWDKPKAGKEYVIVTITIENKGKENLDYNPWYFKLQNSQGQQESMTFTTIDQDTSLQSGQLISGGKITGTVTFEQPKGDTGLVLIYNDSIWSSKELKIKLN